MTQNTKNTGIANYFKFISVLVFILSFVFSVGKVDAAIIPLSNNGISGGQNLGSATVSLNKTSYLTSDPVLLNLSFPTVSSNSSSFKKIIASYRLTNNMNYYVAGTIGNGNAPAYCYQAFGNNVIAQYIECMGIDPVPQGMTSKGDVTTAPLVNSQIANSLPPGTYTLLVLVKLVSDNYYNTALGGLEAALNAPFIYDASGTRYPWKNFNSFFSKSAASATGADIGIYSVTFTVDGFDFALTNDGDKTVNIGDIVTNNINVEALSNTAGDVKLTLDSIKTSSGVNVMNTTNGFTVPANVFAPKTNTVSLTSTGQKDVTPLTLISSPTVSAGTYIAKITGTYTLTTPATPGSSTQYYCKMVLKANNQGYYFGCSPDSNFSPQADFISNLPTSVECIEGDTFGPEPSCTFGNGVLTFWAKDQISNHRLNYGSSICSGSVSVSGDPNNPNTGFTCVISPKPASTQTVVKSTTFNITTRVAPVVIDYDLTLTPGIGGCVTPPLYIDISWKAIPNATSYNVYRTFNNSQQNPIISVVSNPVNGRISTNDNSNSYGAHNTLTGYRVVALINGVEIAQSSPQVFIFSPPLTPSEQCVTRDPVINLLSKKTSSGSFGTTDLSLNKNETFDLTWGGSNLENYSCSQVTTMPNWSINNSIWSYGNSIEGSTAGLSVAGLSPGTYNLRISCTNGVRTIPSNQIRITVIYEPVYNLSITSSGDQCFSFDLWIRQTWSAIPGATSYRITRTSGSIQMYVVVPPTVTHLETHMMFAPGTPFIYTVYAVVNGVNLPASAPVNFTAPRVVCPTSTVSKLFIRNSNSTTLNFGSYSTATVLSGVNTTATVIKGLETFDLRWVSDLDSGYTCSPTGSGSGLWPYGTTLSGFANGLNTSGFAAGQYTFSIRCTRGASVITSNTVTLTLVDPVAYNLSITSSGDQCVIDNLWVRATWSAIAGASSYSISSTENSTGISRVSGTGGRTMLYSLANGTTNVFNQGVDYSYSVVARSNGIPIASPSPAITIRTPRQDASLCVGSSILLEIRKNTPDNSAVYSSSATLNKGEFFDLRWTVTNPVGTYMNTQTITAPGGADASNMWSWGNSVSGDNKKISTNKAGIVSGNYIFSMRYDDYNGTGNPSLSSNQVTLTMIVPPEDMCININGFQDSIPPGMVEYSPKICYYDGNPVRIDPNIIKVFLGDSTVISKVLSDATSTSIYRVNKGNNFNIAWRSNLPNNYRCKAQTKKINGDFVNIFPWNTNDSVTGNNTNLSTSDAETDVTYNFFLLCSDSNNPSASALQSNIVKMEVSSIVSPGSVKLWIGNPGILNNDINTPAPIFGYTYKVKKGEMFNIKWVSNLGSGFECEPITRNPLGNVESRWDWNTNRSKSGEFRDLKTSIVEKGIYSFQLKCSDPNVFPPEPSISSNLVKLQVIESTIIEQ